MGALGACGDGSIGETQGASNVGAQDSVQGFLLDESTPTMTRGRLGTADGKLSFVVTVEAGTTTLWVEINGKTFDVTLDGSTVINGHEAVLTTADKGLLQSLVQELNVRFATATTVPAGMEALARVGSYLWDAPVGYVHRRLVNGVEIAEGLAAATVRSVICITKGRTYSVSYSNKAGTIVTKSVLAGDNWGKNAAGTSGDYSCMGRCGAGCTGFGSSRYSLDCLTHDTCSHDMNSSGGGSDTHGCADEYSRASDDLSGSCTSSQ
jgi:hypothetical protein